MKDINEYIERLDHLPDLEKARTMLRLLYVEAIDAKIDGSKVAIVTENGELFLIERMI